MARIKLCVICNEANISCDIKFLNFPSILYYPDQRIITGTVRVTITNNNECEFNIQIVGFLVRPDGVEKQVTLKEETLNANETKSIDISFNFDVSSEMSDPYGIWTLRFMVELL